jgi:hypothetical protein
MATGHTVNYRLLELTNLRVLALDQAELDRLACCSVTSLA